MCGIAGIISCSKNYNAHHLKKMTDALAHRGPDGEGFWMDEEAGIFLGHRRLSIIDLSDQASQPLHYLDRYVIIHNGEIYNYLELRELLEVKGYSFRSHSDTEVVTAAYHCWGTDFLEHLEGMYAFAIWDKNEKTLLLARDRMGEKPLYIYRRDDTGELFFASELKALWSIGLPRQVSEEMLIAYLALGITVHPNDNSRTFYKDYSQLRPGHYCILNAQGPTIIEQIPYWTVTTDKLNKISDKEAIETFQQLFKQSVANRLRSDVSVGTSLSGGLDSSSVVASIHQQKDKRPNYSQHSFTAVFPGFERDEQSYADQVVKMFGLKQHLVMPKQDELTEFLPALIAIQEEPISSASVYAQYKVFEEAKKQGIKVLLDGQGADELLGGYQKYKGWFLQELLSTGKVSRFFKEKKALSGSKESLNWGFENYLAALFPEKASQHLEQRAFERITKSTDLNTDFVKSYATKAITAKPVIRTLNDLLYYNSCISGLNELLRYADKNSMANSCELRLPFLYHPLVEFLFSLPADFKLRNGFTKWILRESMQTMLPAEIVFRKEKIGFEPPQQEWMQQDAVQQQIEAGKENLYRLGILTKSALAKKIQPHTSYAADGKDWRYLSAGLLV